MSRVHPALRGLIESGVQALGFELVDVELAGGREHRLLRVYIDSPRGITVDNCAKVSRQLSAILDVEDPFPGSYLLEVSSPGLDRPLVTPADYHRFQGETIKVRLLQALASGRRNFTGRLLEVANDHIVIDVDSERFDLPFDAIDRAKLVPQV
ncbi:MAG: ribosome maturation factor RimP [Gammaproteobacteria bacterium]|nr:ribosome maturation factor RimP [Gammaproteobacteria bacterium]